MPAKFKLIVPIPYEIDIQKGILTQLGYHPLVAWAARFNSGAAKMPGGKRPIFFNTLEGCSDILGQLKNGRFLAIEVKRPPWTHPKDKHEEDQAAFLAQVRKANGVAFFATSYQQVEAGLDRARR